MSLELLRRELKFKEDPKKALVSQKFFKTGKGEYGEGDIFLGVPVPEVRKTAEKFKDLGFDALEDLLNSPIHEERLCALLILVHVYQNYPEKQEIVVDFYVKNLKKVNNWDLVDLSAYQILGDYLYNNFAKRPLLLELAKSENLWEKRVSIISTLAYIRNGWEKDTFEIADILMKDEHDLIHKAVGWMLREVGNYLSVAKLEKFLKKRYKKMPRIMLRYAIEKFPEEKRKKYLEGEF